MNSKKKSSERRPSRPFFARFLEHQALQDVVGGVIDPPPTTQKFPSDGDEEQG